MRRFDLVLVVALLATWGIFYYISNEKDGLNRAQQQEIKILNDSTEKINKLLLLERYHIAKAKDTIAMLKVFIKGVEQDRLKQEQKLQAVNARYKALEAKYSNSSVRILDSLRWAWYPDSITVSKRQLR